MGYETLTNLLDRVDKTVTANRNLTARAFGLLLLGKKFDDELKKQDEVRNPTDFIINNPGPSIPDL